MTLADLKTAFQEPLPGIKGHQLLMPSYRNSHNLEAVASKNPKRAGVLVHLFEGVDGIEVLDFQDQLQQRNLALTAQNPLFDRIESHALESQTNLAFGKSTRPAI